MIGVPVSEKNEHHSIDIRHDEGWADRFHQRLQQLVDRMEEMRLARGRFELRLQILRRARNQEQENQQQMD